MTSKAQYIIGIDLGTTNCSLAYIPLSETNLAPNSSLKQFSIEQFTSMGIKNESFLLPSFIYFPLPEEKNSLKETWENKNSFSSGIYAKKRGGELPDRLVASAKSWLCSIGMEGRLKFLPLESSKDIEKISPIEALSCLLSHLKETWDEKFVHAPLNEQQVLITVPASFDPSAKQLVQEAVNNAKYPEVVFLEEPQAAFYAWLNSQEEWRKHLKVGEKILVVDIGGGTTDFSLIGVEEENGNLILNRLAVGPHLLLGGDNLDYSLAYLAKQKLEDLGHTIDEWQMQNLVHLAREAKEALMSAMPPDSVDISLLGRGSRLISGTIQTKIERGEAEKILIDGFFPVVDLQEHPIKESKIGFQQVGLPFVSDPRISCHLAKFLSMKGESVDLTQDLFVIPNSVLFNGGTLKAEAFQKRLIDLLNQWGKKKNQPPVKILPGPDLDFSVSRGAVFYGLARLGQSIRIKSGSSHSYFIGVQESMPAIPGIAPLLKTICVVPYGMEEGEERTLDQQAFHLVLDEKVVFRFFSRSSPTLSDGREATLGTTLKKWQNELTELPSLEVILEKKEGEAKAIQVFLKSKITELGILELWCESENGEKWKLEFSLR